MTIVYCGQVHIRRAEPCRAYHVFGRRRSCTPLAAYVPHVQRMAATYGYRSALVISDSAAVLRNASAAFAPLKVRGPTFVSSRRLLDARCPCPAVPCCACVLVAC